MQDPINQILHSNYFKIFNIASMNKAKFSALTILFAVIVFSACKKKNDAPEAVDNHMPAFFKEATRSQYGQIAPKIVLVAGKSDNVDEPWDIDFHPTRANELWVLNKGTEQSGGTTVTISNAGLPNQSNDFRKDANSWHFMALPSALSFSKENGNWATTAEIQDANRQGGTFTGPSLWSSDMSVYAVPPAPGKNGTHLDMLHGSPYSMGIETDRDNAFWVFDGYYGHIVWYDFVWDHGPGNADHDDGKVHRFTEMKVSRYPGVPSHMVKYPVNNWLYIADPAKGQILRMNTKSGSKKGDLDIINETLAEHWEMQGLEWNVFKNDNLKRPSGMEIIGDLLYVSDYETGEIIVYNLKTEKEMGRLQTGKSKLMGLKADKNGHLWFVANGSSEIYKIEPQ